MVDSLTAQGMVERHQSPADRRAVLVTISKSFLNLAIEIDKAQQNAIDELCSELTEEERAINRAVVDKLYNAIIERVGI